VAHPAERPRIWVAQRTQPWIVRGDQQGAGAEQLSVTEKCAERRHARIIKTAARLVEDQNVWGCSNRHHDRKPTTLTIRESPRWRIKKMCDVKALSDLFGSRCIARCNVRASWSRAKKEA
jgi:hypothetical protein